MCGDHRSLEEMLTHGVIGVLGINHDQLNAWARSYWTSASNFHFHSPYQVQAEFLADVAELSRPQVPSAIIQTARARGNAILAGAFVNGAAYRVGNPRPR